MCSLSPTSSRIAISLSILLCRTSSVGLTLITLTATSWPVSAIRELYTSLNRPTPSTLPFSLRQSGHQASPITLLRSLGSQKPKGLSLGFFGLSERCCSPSVGALDARGAATGGGWGAGTAGTPLSTSSPMPTQVAILSTAFWTPSLSPRSAPLGGTPPDFRTGGDVAAEEDPEGTRSASPAVTSHRALRSMGRISVASGGSISPRNPAEIDRP
mmetsp:Transcript_23538/g.59557  ORF Transcript_23538/g.59557 Transcript_23538/m.59557 type:complete len:214 (-) Transcript_23538:7-648(-)